MIPQRLRHRTPSRWVGLDLGSSSIKFVELEQTAHGPRLIKGLIQELPRPQDGQAVDLVGWLQSMMAECSLRDVHVAIGGPGVAIRRVHVPLMPKRELPAAVKWQVKEQLPFSSQEAVVDFHVLGEVWEKDVKKQDVLVAAGSKPLLHELVALVERAGACVASLSPAPVAAWHCVTALIPEAREGSVALIEIGASKTDVTIAKDGQIRLVRELAVGSDHLTVALIGAVSSESGEVAIDYSKAEGFKRRYGILTESAQGTTEEGVPLFHLASLMRPVLEQLMTELSRVLDFYKVQIEEAGVSRVLLCGAGANLKHLQPFLTNGLGMTVEVFNPLVRIPDRLQRIEAGQVVEDGPRLAVAVGLALDHGQGLNLLPAEVRQVRVSAVSRRVWVGVTEALAGIAFVCYLGLQLTALVFDHRLRSQQPVWEQLAPTYTTYMQVTSSRKALEGTLTQAQQFLDQQPVWEGLFKELGELTPSAIELDEFRMAANDETTPPRPMWFHVKGRVAGGNASAQDSLSRFVEALERSVFFKEVELVSSEVHAGDTDTTRFDIRGMLE